MGEKDELEGLLNAARMILVSARTAPKAKGVDDVLLKLVTERKELEKLAKSMKNLSGETNWGFFERDSRNVQNSHAVVLFGLKETHGMMSLHCGGCGFSSCEEYWKMQKKKGKSYSGPICCFKLLDLGIAIGSAVKMASILNIDNRVMFSIGTAAIKAGMMDTDICIGIPLSFSGKSPYYDRK